MLTMNKARRLALDAVASHLGCPPDELSMPDEKTQCRRIGWIFFAEPHALGRPGPVIVTHAGVVHRLDADSDLHTYELREREERRARREALSALR